MYATVATIQTAPDHFEEGLRNTREQLLPEFQRQAGFKGFRLLVDRRSGKALGISFWETEASAQASEAVLQQRRAQAASVAGAREAPAIERYEVVLEA